MLSGFRVLDLTDERGFLAGKILADLGADVVKVEAPGGDPGRSVGPYLGGVCDPERSLRWLALNTSKRGITLDLDRSEGAGLFRRLAASTDVVLESSSPGTQNARGLSFESLRADHPGLVGCAITPFGQTGPRAHYAAHDLVVVAMGGNVSMTGDADRPPVRCSLPTSYYHAGPEAVIGIVMALSAREESGRGDFVDISLQECQLASLITGAGQYQKTRRLGQRSGGSLGRTREIWPAKDGWISYGLRGGPARIPNLSATVEYMHECGAAPDWLRDYDWPGYSPISASDEELARLEDAFGSFFRGRTMRELYTEALARRILLAPCNDAREIVEQAQLRARELYVTLDYPELGAAIEHPNFFAKTSGGGIRIRRRAPRIGEHNAEVYGAMGVDTAELDRLRADGVV